MWTFNRNTGVLKYYLKITKFPDNCYKMEKTLSEEEKQKINALLEKHHPREGIQRKEMIVLSEKGKEIGIETEVTSSSVEPFED